MMKIVSQTMQYDITKQREFLCLDKNVLLTGGTGIQNYFYFVDTQYDSNNLTFQQQVLSTISDLVKEHLTGQIRMATLDFYDKRTGGVRIRVLDNQTEDINILDKNSEEALTATIYFDVSAYWYDEELKQIEKVVLPGGGNIVMYTHPRTVVHLYYMYNWFGNHIVREWPFIDKNESLYYFEPAAKLNRQMMRNLSAAIQKAFPDIIVEFETHRCRTFPYDNFGFMDNADQI
jgi:hypothetical protein